MVGVGVVGGFEWIGWKGGEEMFSRDIVEGECIFA